MKLEIKKGAVDQTLILFISDSSSTTGAGLTGLVYNSASLTCYYVRPLSVATALTLVTQTVTGAHSDGGFIEIDSTNMPGVYRLDLSDAIITSGVDSVVVMLKGATNMASLPLEIQLVDNIEKDTYDIVNHASYGNAQLTRSTIPANTLDISATGEAGIDWGNIGSPTTVVDLSGTDINLVDTSTTNTDMVSEPPTANAIADQVFDEAKSGHTAAGSFGEEIQTHSLSSELTTHDGKLDTVDTVVDGIQTDLNNATDGLGALKALIDIIDTVVDAVKAVTDVLPNSGALSDIDTGINNLETRVPDIISLVNINTEVDNALDTALPASPTSGSINDILDRQEELIVAGSATTGTLSTTEMTTDLIITVADQFNGRILTFRKDTITAALQGQQTDITATTVLNGKLGFTALTTAPVNGDKFDII